MLTRPKAARKEAIVLQALSPKPKKALFFAVKVKQHKAEKIVILFLEKQIFLALASLRQPSKEMRQPLGKMESETAEGQKNPGFSQKNQTFLWLGSTCDNLPKIYQQPI